MFLLTRINKKLSNIAILTIVLLGSFLFIGKSQALFDYYFQTYDVISPGSDFDTDDYGGLTNLNVQRFKVDADGTLENITMEYTTVGTYKPSLHALNLADLTDDLLYYLPVQSTGTTTAINPFIVFATSSVTITMDKTHDYAIMSRNHPWGVHSASSTYNNTDSWDETGKRSVISPPYVASDLTFSSGNKTDMDIWFRVKIAGTLTNSELFINNTPSSTCNFLFNKVSYRLSQDDIDTLTSSSITWAPIFIAYGTTPSYLPYYVFENTLGLITTQTVYVPDLIADTYYSTGVANAPNFTPGQVYYATAYICKDENYENCDPTVNPENLLVASSQWEFIVPETSAGVCPANNIPLNEPEQVNPTGGNQTTCETANTWWDIGLCKMWSILLKPDQKYFDQFSYLKTKISNKPPFGYFTVYYAQFNNLSTTTSSTIDLVMGNEYNDTMAEIKNISVITTIQNFIGYLMWFLFGWWVYHRFRHFKL